MGLLSSVLTLGGAAIGAAVGGPAGAQLGASLGGAVGGAVSGSSGAKKATKAQLAAIAEGRRLAGEAKTEAIGYQQPYLNFGSGSVNALSSRLGIQSGAPAVAAPSANALTMGPTPSGPQGPPLASRGAGGASADAAGVNWPALNAPGLEYASDDFGSRQSAPAPNAPPQSQPSPDVPMNALNDGPVGGAATQGVDPGTYGTTANPTAPTPYQPPANYVAPDAPEAYKPPGEFRYGIEDYKASPGFQYRLDKAVNTVQGSAAAQGSLFSGATLKELSDRASNEAYADFGRERDFAAGRYDTGRNFDYGLSRDARADYQDTRNFGANRSDVDRNFGYGLTRDARSDYQDDRNYLTNRFDTQTNNLFRGVGVGQGAAGTASAAATRYGDQAVGLATDVGQVKAANALTQGQIGADLATGLGGVIAGAIPGFTGGGAPANALTMGEAWGFQPKPTSVSFVNTPANIRY